MNPSHIAIKPPTNSKPHTWWTPKAAKSPEIKLMHIFCSHPLQKVMQHKFKTFHTITLLEFYWIHISSLHVLLYYSIFSDAHPPLAFPEHLQWVGFYYIQALVEEWDHGSKPQGQSQKPLLIPIEHNYNVLLHEYTQSHLTQTNTSKFVSFSHQVQSASAFIFADKAG